MKTLRRIMALTWFRAHQLSGALALSEFNHSRYVRLVRGPESRPRLRETVKLGERRAKISTQSAVHVAASTIRSRRVS